MKVLSEESAQTIQNDDAISGLMSLKDVQREVPEVEKGDIVMDEIGYFWKVE